jgi:hypothetical protein
MRQFHQLTDKESAMKKKPVCIASSLRAVFNAASLRDREAIAEGFVIGNGIIADLPADAIIEDLPDDAITAIGGWVGNGIIGKTP